MRAALYLRVSTTDQTTENQERELRAAADRLGHVIVEVYREIGVAILGRPIGFPLLVPLAFARAIPAAMRS
jgi:DNA invertase Pin-like site-specific DNA recombinase